MQKQIDFLLRGASVRRFHTIPVVLGETTGHHSAIVAGLLLLLWPERMTVPLLRYAILHDSAEFVTGDIPSPVKRAIDRAPLDRFEKSVYEDWGINMQELSPEDRKIFKFADNLAGIATCTGEMRAGNTHLLEACSNFLSYFLASYDPVADGPRPGQALDSILNRLPIYLRELITY